MREPSRGLAARGRPAISHEQAQEQLGIDQDEENQAMGEEFEHEGEEGHFFGEGGEDEMVEMMGAEGGEEEMMEMMGAEAGEEEMAEEGAEEAENDEWITDRDKVLNLVSRKGPLDCLKGKWLG